MSKQKISPDELAACRKRLEQVWKSRVMDEGLIHQAWHTAQEVAALLYDEFNATQVFVFGSLTEPMAFTKKSDIDIAVSGLSNDAYDKAYGKVVYFEAPFKIDFVNFDTSKGLFRERMKHQAIPIEKGTRPPNNTTDVWQTLYKHLQRQVFPTEEGDIYEMNRKRLTQRIDDELDKIKGTLERIQRGLDNIDVLPVQAREFIENTIATDLADIYMGIERIFERIGRDVDRHVPRGNQWHKNLLAQMAEKRLERPPVISENTRRELEELLKFRHKVTNIYGKELRYEMTIPHAKSIGELFERVSEDMNRFTDSLVRREEDV